MSSSDPRQNASRWPRRSYPMCRDDRRCDICHCLRAAETDEEDGRDDYRLTS